jgi:predicted nucleic acid-binding protein
MTPSGLLVVDASVAIKWYVPEPDSQRALKILSGGTRLLAPDLLIAEVGNILWKKVRRGELTMAEARAIASALTKSSPLELCPASELLATAMSIAVAHQRSVYDSLYVALAHERSCQLVTADERLVSALSGTPYTSLMLSLSQV